MSWITWVRMRLSIFGVDFLSKNVWIFFKTLLQILCCVFFFLHFSLTKLTFRLITTNLNYCSSQQVGKAFISLIILCVSLSTNLQVPLYKRKYNIKQCYSKASFTSLQVWVCLYINKCNSWHACPYVNNDIAIYISHIRWQMNHVLYIISLNVQRTLWHMCIPIVKCVNVHYIF